MLEDLFVGVDSPIKGQVDTFADLPATAELGDLFVVKTTTGVIGINRKLKGLYRWDSAAWVFADGIEANKVIYNNADSSLTAGTVKAAIDELDTKRQDASNLTSGTLAPDRLPSGINADQVDGLEASQFVRADTLFHAINSSTRTPNSTATEYYAIFDTIGATDTDIYSSSTPTESANTGIRLLQAGKYKVSYTLNWANESYGNRVNFSACLVKHSSAITPTETEIPGTKTFSYTRHYNYVKYATTTCIAIVDLVANEYIKCRATVAKNDRTFNDTFNGLRYVQYSSIIIEYLGNFAVWSE